MRAGVLVIGGGLAATMAALTARRAGADVVMVVKGAIGESGSSSKAAGVFAAAFNHCADRDEMQEDTVDLHAADTLAIGDGLSSEAHARAVAEDAIDGVRELERLGVEFSKRDDGRFHQVKLVGNTRHRGCSVVGGGAALMAALRRRVSESGIRVVERAIGMRLLHDGGEVLGARVRLLDEGRDVDVVANGTVIASGGPTGLFNTVSGDRRNTGDGLAMAYEAGAELANPEFVEFTLIFKVGDRLLPIAGLSPLVARGARPIDRDGRHFLESKYDAEHLARLGRAELLRAVVEEISAGHGPIFLECSRIDEAAWREFEYSGASFLDKLREAGQNYRRDPIEVVPAAHSILFGIVTGSDAQTSLQRLWAAGECAAGVHGAARLSGNGLSAGLVFGRRAGRAAAAASALSRDAGERVRQATPSAGAPAESGVSALRAEVSGLAESSLTVVRDAQRLRAANARFRQIERSLEGCSSLAAIETRQLALLGELMTAGSLQRRDGAGHLIVRRGPSGEPQWEMRETLVRLTAPDSPASSRHRQSPSLR